MGDEKAKMTGAALLREYLRTNIDTFYRAETNPGKKWTEHLEIEQEILSRFRAGEKAKAEVEGLRKDIATLCGFVWSPGDGDTPDIEMLDRCVRRLATTRSSEVEALRARIAEMNDYARVGYAFLHMDLRRFPAPTMQGTHSLHDPQTGRHVFAMGPDGDVLDAKTRAIIDKAREGEKGKDDE